jgi:hypothetical protein
VDVALSDGPVERSFINIQNFNGLSFCERLDLTLTDRAVDANNRRLNPDRLALHLRDPHFSPSFHQPFSPP